MSGNAIDLMSDSEVKNSSTYTMGTSPNPHLPSPNKDHIESKIITIFDNCNLKRASRDSLGEETFPYGSSYALISNVGGGMAQCLDRRVGTH